MQLEVFCFGIVFDYSFAGMRLRNYYPFCLYTYSQVLPVELTRLPLLEKLYLDNNKLSLLPSELGELKSLKVLRVDYNMLISVPGQHGTFFIYLFNCSNHVMAK